MEKPAITQEMIDLYNEYTHLTLDRRGFMERLTKLAGSAAAAAAIAPMLSASPAFASIVAADDPRVDGGTITFPGPMGDIGGYMVRPAGVTTPIPSVVVIHENRGLNEHIRDVARRVALEGFAALAPDLLSRLGGTPDDEDEARQMINNLARADAVEDAMATLEFIKGNEATTDKAGALGFCWGGGMTNALAVAAGSELDAAVSYYGPQPPAEDVAKIEAPLLLQYAGLDTWVDAGVAGYRKALEENGKTFTIYTYEGVNHAFNNDTSQARYDEKAAKLAWGRTVAFLKQYLG